MNGLSRRDWLRLTAATPLLAACSRESSSADLIAGWNDPPLSARPAAYWTWVNGITDRARMTYELKEVRAKGMSGVYIFDIGARGREDVVPEGVAYMGPESLDAIAHTIREAGRLGLEVGFITSSSWNAGGSWTKPEHAAKGLSIDQEALTGGSRIARRFTEPVVAALAVPGGNRLPGHDFVIELYPAGVHEVNRVVIYNSGGPNPAKGFAVFVSDTDAEPGSFRRVLSGTLKSHARAQEFRSPTVRARYVMLRVLDGHRAGPVELAEFEVYSTDGRNVAALRDADGSRTAANMIRFTDQAGNHREWQAQNIHDGAHTGARGTWRSTGLPPVAVEDPNLIVDLSSRVDEAGNLAWDAPPGDWVLMTFTSANTGQQLAVPSPKSQGLAIDHFSAEASREHLRYLFERLESKVGRLDETALEYVYACSYELRGSTWTPDFSEQFRQRRGYDITPYLPVLAGAQVGGYEVTERFRHDYRKTVGELLVDAFYRVNREEANKRGLRFVAEAGGPGLPLHQVPVDALQAQGSVDVPRGEFWKEHNVWVVKETANAAHVYGKKVVQMEAFTSFRHWQDGPADLKGIADRAFVGGANQFVWHTMPHTPPEAGLPGWVYHAGTHFGPHLVWWEMAKPFLDYISRCSFMLQQGLYVADACFYYGDGGYKFVPEDLAHPKLGRGYSFDYVNAEVILTRMEVRDGRIVLPEGMSYRLLVLPDDDSIDLEVLRRLKRLADKGATILGPRPTKSSGLAGYPKRDDEVRELAGFISEADPHDMLGSPDFQCTADIDFIHRRTENADIYFLRNPRDEEVEAECAFRDAHGEAELWDPVSGERYRTDPTKIYLPPDGATFVVFRDQSDAPPLPQTSIIAEHEITGPWTVRFPERWGAPSEATFDRLISWTKHPDKGIRYFSGIATYEKEIEIAETGDRLFIDLGRMRFVAEILLNGQSAGIVWTRPFRTEITALTKPGRNRLTVRVANTWSNRLTGDAVLGESYCSTNVVWSKDTPLLESGLLGPVKLVTWRGL